MSFVVQRRMEGSHGPRKWWQPREDYGPASAPGPVRYAFPLTGVKVKEEQRGVRTASLLDLYRSRSLGDVSATQPGRRSTPASERQAS